MHVDRDLPIPPGRALRFLTAVAAALGGGNVHLRPIARIDPRHQFLQLFQRHDAVSPKHYRSESRKS